MLPEWAPNLHPVVVHFPIALLIVAVLADLLALIRRGSSWLSSATASLYVLGAIAAWAAFLSGREAAEGVLLPAAANPILTEHADWAQRTAWLYGLLALVRLVAVWQGWIRRVAVHLILFLVAAGGLFALYETGDHGAQLVYQYGVGVGAVDTGGMKAHDHARHQESWEEGSHAQEPAGDTHGHMAQEEEESGTHGDIAHETAVTGLELAENGAWTWNIGPGSERGLEQHFEWLSGSPEDLVPKMLHDGEKGEVLALHPQGGPTIFVTGIPVGSLQADLSLNSDSFAGTVMIVHHIQNTRNYYFLSLDRDHIRLGEVRDGSVKIQDKKVARTEGWRTVRVVGDKTHFRGYIGGKMVVHGHGEEPQPGRVGLLVEGTGTLLLDDFKVEVLR